MFVAVALCLLALANGFTLPPVPMPDGRIVGGSPANILDAPYQIALLFDRSNVGQFDHNCGGTLISRRAVLTAAHCTDKTFPVQWMARAGSTYHNNGGILVPGSRIEQHASFDMRLNNDIAILFLGSPLVLDRDIQLATLPSQGQTVADGESAFITGWGLLNEGGNRPTQLNKLTVPVLNQQRCATAYASINPVTANMICAGSMSGGQDACQGDSGGPMIVNGFLIGITSWGSGCARPGYPGVYTRVPMFRNWINSQNP